MKHTLKEITNSAFQTALVVYLILLLVEELMTGSISTYINLNYLLILVLVLGVLTVLFPVKIEKKKQKVTKKDYLYISLLSIAGIIIIFIKTKELGWLSYLISGIAGILIFILSLLILEDEEKN